MFDCVNAGFHGQNPNSKVQPISQMFVWICMQRIQVRFSQNNHQNFLESKQRKWETIPVIDGSGFCAPNAAILQLALLPSITGFGFWQAIVAEFGSLKVTYKTKTLGIEAKILVQLILNPELMLGRIASARQNWIYEKIS